jgi:hypothetical protein
LVIKQNQQQKEDKMLYGMIFTIIVSSIGNLTTITGRYEEDYLGWERGLSKAGDVNGDGYDDFMYTVKSQNKVWMLLGGPNFDNAPDIYLVPPVTYQGDVFGWALAGGCDINQDGYDDVIVACKQPYQSPSAHGRVYVYYGGSNMDGNADITITSPDPTLGDDFGYDICAVKPYFFDPIYYDIVVGAPHANGHIPYGWHGLAYVFHYPDYTTYSLLDYHDYVPNAMMGEAVAAGDFDNDWVSEIAVGGSAYQGDIGTVVVSWLYSGGGIVIKNGTDQGGRFGWDLETGDVTNDGIDDLFISAYRAYPNKVYVSYGVNGTWNFNINQTLTGDNDFDMFGFQISYCDDVNNDQIGDVLIGAPQQTTGSGKAFVYFGGNGAIDNYRDLNFEGEQNNSCFGHSVAGIGDINGDWFNDFVVGAPLYNPGGKPYAGRLYVYGELNSMLTSDPGALAYNDNRHLVREPNSVNLHLVYTNKANIMYIYSINGGTDWSSANFIAAGVTPAIALGPNNIPAVAWTNSVGGLYFGRKNGALWDVYELYNPVQPTDPIVNSPPAMVISPAERPSPVYILATFSGRGSGNVTHEVRYYYFEFGNPTATYTTIETAVAPSSPLRRHSPTLVRNEIDNWLHAAWIRKDTICYARKAPGQIWTIYGNPFVNDGLRSAYPYVESYGDSIYLVWQNKATPTSPEDIWRARRPRIQYSWERWNLSNTSTTLSLYPINTSGLFTVFVDEATNPVNYDVFFKIRPTDPLTNLSQTSTKSYYPQGMSRRLLKIG